MHVELQRKYLRFTAGNTPGAGTNNVTVSGTYLFPIVVSVPHRHRKRSTASMSLPSPTRPSRARPRPSPAHIAELTSYQNTLYEGSFRTYTDGFRSGQVLSINSTQRTKAISVLVQCVIRSMRDPTGTQFEYEVKFATLKSSASSNTSKTSFAPGRSSLTTIKTILNYYPARPRSRHCFRQSRRTFRYHRPLQMVALMQERTTNKLIWGYGTWA